MFGGTSAPEPVVDSGWAAFKEEKPARPPPPKPKPEVPKRPPQVHVNPSSRPNTPSVVIKAPSLESIKSWNCAVAENLIRKSEIEALEAGVLAEEEFDPFDTTQFEDEDRKEEGADEDIVDPFDTSEIPDFEKEERLKREAEEEAKRLEEEAKKKAEVDLLTDENDLGLEDLGEVTIVPDKGPEPDPFDTGFAAKVLPNHGDPFDTSFVTGCPGKAEIHALEEEFIDKEEFDPRTAEGSSIPRKTVAPGAAGRARPKKGLATDLKVKIPIPVEATKKEEEVAIEEEEEDDPFDTSIVSKVIPVTKARQRSDLSVEDEDFDPTSTFQKIQKEEFDPFDTSIATAVIPELAENQAEPEPEPKEEEVIAEEKPAEVVQPEPPKQPEPLALQIDGKPFKILPPGNKRLCYLSVIVFKIPHFTSPILIKVRYVIINDVI